MSEVTMPGTLPVLWHSGLLGSTYDQALQGMAVADPSLKLSVGRALGDELQVLAAVRRGEIAGAIVTSVALGSLDDRFAVAELPYVLSSRNATRRFWAGPTGLALLDALPMNGIRPVATLDAGLRHFFAANSPIGSAQDLAGKHFRIMPSIYHSCWLLTMGVHPVSIPPTQFRSALAAEAVDGAERSLSNIIEYDLTGLIRHVALTGHLAASAFVVFSERWWVSLRERSRVALAEAGSQVSRSQSEQYRTADEQAEALLNDAGVAISRPPLEPFERAASAVQQFFAGRGPDNSELLTRAMEESRG